MFNALPGPCFHSVLVTSLTDCSLSHRLDAARAGFGEINVLTAITSVLGKSIWKETLVVLTHANAAREKLGRDYGQVGSEVNDITTLNFAY